MSRSLSERKLSKFLNSELQFNSTGLSVESGNADPTVTIVEAKKGSLYLCTNGNLYKKQSDLLDLDWIIMPESAGGVDSVNGETGVVVLDKSDIGLSNVDNTSDANKPVSSAQAIANTADRARANHTGTQLAATISDFSSAASSAAPVQSVAGQTGVVVLAKVDVGLSNVDNTADSSKPVSTAQGLADTAIQNFSIQRVNHTGTQLAATISDLSKNSVGLGNVDNTSDATKDAAATTLTNKTLTSPVINTPTGIVKGDVGLGNVDNTSDANKPVSTDTQTALNLKANLASPTLTGVPLAPTAAPATNTTQIATTAFVTTAVSGVGGANTTLSNLSAATTINQQVGFDLDNTYDIGDVFKAVKDIWFAGYLRLQSGVTTIVHLRLSGLSSVLRHMGGIGSSLNIESTGATNINSDRKTTIGTSHGFEVVNSNVEDIKLRIASGGGSIVLDPKANSGGLIKFLNNNITPTVGHVWTATTTEGAGEYLRFTFANNKIKSTQTTAPTATVNANAGTGATSTVANATDTAGTVNLTTTAVAGAAGTLTTVNFNSAYAVAPRVIITPKNGASALAMNTLGIFVTATTTTFTISSANADVVGAVYAWDFFCIETQ